MLSITNHLLRGETSHHGRAVSHLEDNRGGLLVPEAIVCHFTVTRVGMSTAASLAAKANKNSVHIVGDREGDLIQQVPFNKIAHHAGKSAWNGRPLCSRRMIGVELCNWGPLFPDGNGGWLNYYKKPVLNAQVYHGRHHLHRSCQWEHWEKYTDEQMISLAELCRLLVEVYPTITEIVGHDDIADPPGRKADPGPAFDMRGLRLAVFGEPSTESTETGENHRA